MVKVRIPNKAVSVKVGVSNTGQLIPTQPITVTSLPVAPPGERMDLLTDVDATAEVEGGVPVYHAANDSYVVEKLDFDALVNVDQIDGGTF